MCHSDWSMDDPSNLSLQSVSRVPLSSCSPNIALRSTNCNDLCESIYATTHRQPVCDVTGLMCADQSSCNTKTSGWFTRLLRSEANHRHQTLLGHVYCYFPDHAHARSTFWLAEDFGSIDLVSNAPVFVLLGLSLAVLARVLLDCRLELPLSTAVHLNPGSAAPVRCYRGFSLLGSVLTVVASSGDCFWLVRAPGSITFSIRCGSCSSQWGDSDKFVCPCHLGSCKKGW